MHAVALSCSSEEKPRDLVELQRRQETFPQKGSRQRTVEQIVTVTMHSSWEEIAETVQIISIQSASRSISLSKVVDEPGLQI